MLQSKLFAKTLREDPKDEFAINARVLSRAGFVQKLMSGVYQFLPLGLRVLFRIEDIIREEINNLGAEEILMPALHPKEHWERTGRFQTFDALFKVISHFGKEFALAPTHEESIVPLVQRSPLSYKDFPFALYQIQTKFRDEPRAKSGLLRGKEFRMKDLYSFHTDEKSLDEYYERVAQSYDKIFARCGLKAVRTRASGGSFSQFSDEYQVLIEEGEDVIFLGDDGEASNREIVPKEFQDVELGTKVEFQGKTWVVRKSAEVGNIFKLYTKYSQPFGLTFADENGLSHEVLMGCYGIGSSRIMGTIVEVYFDQKKGMRWPKETAPFDFHLIALHGAEKEGNSLYQEMKKNQISVLYDDREEYSAGEKFADADLIGIPYRVTVSPKTIEQNKVEVYDRTNDNIEHQSRESFIDQIC